MAQQLFGTGLRYLPHVADGEILHMGLSRPENAPWFETDSDIGRYHRHKLQLRSERGDAVYRTSPESLPAQQELAAVLRQYLLGEQAANYSAQDNLLHCLPGDFHAPLAADEILWNCSLLVADDLVLMQERAGQYHLTAASLCSPSHWSLAEKFGLPLRDIHDPIPGFHARLTPRVERFFSGLRAGPPFVRFNWSLQAGDALAQFPGEESPAAADTELYYRVERQSLKRLPESGAIVFTIRVYLHPLEALDAIEGALPALLDTIGSTPDELLHYKGLDRLAPALGKYRGG
ncbi:heme-dependent oxidative N-demethylase family protein [Haliea sp. E17]|uniref:heme-dependent oxidative N-demethylase family protein n=1 Tax=Haliea sp. E17 TaxID=3401576 RepID=UPI003AADC026